MSTEGNFTPSAQATILDHEFEYMYYVLKIQHLSGANELDHIKN